MSESAFSEQASAGAESSEAGSSEAQSSEAQSSEQPAGTAAEPRRGRALRWVAHPLARAAEALGKRYLRRLTGVGSLTEAVAVIPRRMHLAANQTRLVLEMLEDVKAGRYRDLPWRSVALASAAVLYTVSPADIVPDAVPLLGTLDDVAVVAIAVRLIQRDLLAYCRFKGYQEDEYFDFGEARASARRAAAPIADPVSTGVRSSLLRRAVGVARGH